MVQLVMGFVMKDQIEIVVFFNNEVVEYWLVKLFGIVGFFYLLVGELLSVCGCLIRVFLDVQYGYVDSKWLVVIDL